MIHAWKMYGEDAANDEHKMKYYRRAGRRSGVPSLRQVLYGKLEFVRMVKGTQDEVYRNLQKQFVAVCPDYIEVMQRENSHMCSRDVFISHASED